MNWVYSTQSLLLLPLPTIYRFSGNDLDVLPTGIVSSNSYTDSKIVSLLICVCLCLSPVCKVLLSSDIQAPYRYHHSSGASVTY